MISPTGFTTNVACHQDGHRGHAVGCGHSQLTTTANSQEANNGLERCPRLVADFSEPRWGAQPVDGGETRCCCRDGRLRRTTATCSVLP